MILFDTDVCIEILRGNESVIQRRYANIDTVAISFITEAELYYGAYKSTRPDHNTRLVDKFLLTVDVRHSDRAITKRFAHIKEQLRSQGAPLADADVFIAATAICSQATLISGNLRHYQRIEGLVIENWIRE